MNARRSGGALVASLLVALVGCSGISGGGNDDTPSAEEESAYAESAPPSGEPVDFFLYTHCGVESLRLAGKWWHAKAPLYGTDGEGSPPEGWGDPYQKGTLTLHSTEHVTFEAHEITVDFLPVPTDRSKTICR